MMSALTAVQACCRQTERQRHKQTDRETHKQTERQRHR